MMFMRARAEDLADVSDETVDVVTTRSLLIYVEDKEAAFRAFHRVLKNRGRLSIIEPINNYFPETFDDFWGYDARPVRDLVRKIWEYEGWVGQVAETDPMLKLHREGPPSEGPPSARRVGGLRGDRPRAPCRCQAGHVGALTNEEAARQEAQIRPLADAGRGVIRDASAYLSAVKR
jgi:SAM-dependent methyltransferase